MCSLGFENNILFKIVLNGVKIIVMKKVKLNET